MDDDNRVPTLNPFNYQIVLDVAGTKLLDQDTDAVLFPLIPLAADAST